jgi:hypothetical protein
VVLAQLLLSPARGGLSGDSFSRIWQQEFGSPTDITQQLAAQQLANAKPQVAAPRFDSNAPHPAVVRVVADEQGATSLGSGTLVDVRENFGLVMTNWHVVRDARGPIQVHFPGGFTSQARVLKMDNDWDLAALVIWRPPVDPVPIAVKAPQPGDQLTICGYGPGIYRAVTGRCTQYYAPQTHLPQQMVELDVEARQGDSGGPIFNSRGELAGVLFGAGKGTTMGSFGGRVDDFLASLAPDIGDHPSHKPSDEALVQDGCPQEATYQSVATQTSGKDAMASAANEQSSDLSSNEVAAAESQAVWQSRDVHETDLKSVPAEPTDMGPTQVSDVLAGGGPTQPTPVAQVAEGNTQSQLFDQVKTALAAFGVLSLAMLLVKAAG